MTNALIANPGTTKRRISRSKPLLGAYVSLVLFMIIYCSRPGDWIPGLSGIPLAKVAGIIALLALVFSVKNVQTWPPREVFVLLLLTGQLFIASVFSPVWRGGALSTAFDFAKILTIVFVMSIVANTAERLHRLIFVQAVSVASITAISIWKSRLLGGRLEGAFGGDYSNPNDLALAIVISLPLCLALLFLARNVISKVAWALAMAVMSYAVFLTGSRGGFLAFFVTAAFCLWGFAIRGPRRYLLVFAAVVAIVLWQSSGEMLSRRFSGTFDRQADTASSYGSTQERKKLFWRSVEVTQEHPLFGVGPGNFPIISGYWRVTHNSFTQMSSEAGVPALILYVLVLYYGFRNVRAFKLFARSQKGSGLLARALQASLAGYVVGSLFASTAYDYFPYFMVAYTTGLFQIAKKSVASSEPLETLGTLPIAETRPDEDTKHEWSWH